MHSDYARCIVVTLNYIIMRCILIDAHVYERMKREVSELTGMVMELSKKLLPSSNDQ